MTLPSKPIMVRIPAELSDNFESLKEEFPGIPQAMILRFILSSIFEQPISEQIKIINDQIRGNKEMKSKNRVEGAGKNSRRINP